MKPEPGEAVLTESRLIRGKGNATRSEGLVRISAVSRHVPVNKLYVESASERNHRAEEVIDFSAWKAPSRLQYRASNPSAPPTPHPRAESRPVEARGRASRGRQACAEMWLRMHPGKSRTRTALQEPDPP